jgi:hypothetical protein
VRPVLLQPEDESGERNAERGVDGTGFGRSIVGQHLDGHGRDAGHDQLGAAGSLDCGDDARKDNLEVEFALKSKANPIGVAEYQLKGTLPAKLRGKLPTARQLEEAMREAFPSAG